MPDPNSRMEGQSKLKIGGKESQWPVTPLLFLIYINDICKAVPDAKVKLYADDTNLFLFDTDANNQLEYMVRD